MLSIVFSCFEPDGPLFLQFALSPLRFFARVGDLRSTLVTSISRRGTPAFSFPRSENPTGRLVLLPLLGDLGVIFSAYSTPRGCFA